MQRKLNLTRVIYLQMGKTTEAKPHWANLRSPLPRIHYYQNKRLLVKGISVPNTNLQLNPYPNTQLDLQCSDNLSFQCTAPSTWLTNQCTDLSMWLTHQLEKDIDCKVHQFIQTMKIKKLLGYKTLGTKTQQLLQRIWWTRAILSPVTICVQQQLQQPLHHLWRHLKKSLYMSKVVRKETLHKYTWICMKTDLEIWICNSQ